MTRLVVWLLVNWIVEATHFRSCGQWSTRLKPGLGRDWSVFVLVPR